MYEFTITTVQAPVVAVLERAGFIINRVVGYDDENGPTVFMSRRRRGTTFYAEVDPNGDVNGMDSNAFMQGLK